jgi:hypothetical protein
MKYFDSIIDYLIEKKTIPDDIYKDIIHPYSFLSFCDFVYSNTKTIKNTTKKLNINLLKDNNTIFIDSNRFNDFIDNVLPNINKKINVVTARHLLPQVQKSKRTELLLNNKYISVWFAQNPIYENSSKYIAIPYGLRVDNSIKIYLKCVIANLNTAKTIYLSHLPAGVHKHLPKDHIRRNTELGYSSTKKIDVESFYENMCRSFFTISLSGDRHDCYRHYEAIGLGTIPVSNIPIQYKNIFGDSVIINKNIQEILDLIKNRHGYNYQKPNRDIITTKYWYQFFLEKIY